MEQEAHLPSCSYTRQEVLFYQAKCKKNVDAFSLGGSFKHKKSKARVNNYGSS